MPEESISLLSQVKTTLKTTISSTFKYVNEGVGAAIAVPFALFNAVTTTTGAGKLLPLGIGYPIGILISLAYFVILTSTKVKAQHPLRRFLLLLIFAPASAYTSFFSIYDQISGGRLEQQALKEIVNSHNNLVIGIDAYLKEIKSQAESSLKGKIEQIKKIDEEIKEAENKRTDHNKFDQDSRGSAADVEKKKRAEKERLQNQIQKLPNYIIYEKIRQTNDTYSENLNNLLDTKNLLDSKDSPEVVFQKDQKLYLDVKAEIEGFFPEIKQKFNNIGSFESLKPVEENYVLIPVFLIPLNNLLSNNKQARFISIALIIAIGMEVVPILLSGIHIIEQESNPANQTESSDSAKK